MSSFGEMLRKASDSDYVEPPKGQYKIVITGGECRETSKGARAEVILKITEGEQKDAQVQHALWFTNPVGVQINTEALVSYGVDLSAIEESNDLDDAIQKLVGRTADVGISYKDGYMRINVHGSRAAAGQTRSDVPSNGADQAPAASFAAAAGAGADDTVPF